MCHIPHKTFFLTFSPHSLSNNTNCFTLNDFSECFLSILSLLGIQMNARHSQAVANNWPHLSTTHYLCNTGQYPFFTNHNISQPTFTRNSSSSNPFHHYLSTFYMVLFYAYKLSKYFGRCNRWKMHRVYKIFIIFPSTPLKMTTISRAIFKQASKGNNYYFPFKLLPHYNPFDLSTLDVFLELCQLVFSILWESS